MTDFSTVQSLMRTRMIWISSLKLLRHRADRMKALTQRKNTVQKQYLILHQRRSQEAFSQLYLRECAIVTKIRLLMKILKMRIFMTALTSRTTIRRFRKSLKRRLLRVILILQMRNRQLTKNLQLVKNQQSAKSMYLNSKMMTIESLSITT